MFACKHDSHTSLETIFCHERESFSTSVKIDDEQMLAFLVLSMIFYGEQFDDEQDQGYPAMGVLGV